MLTMCKALARISVHRGNLAEHVGGIGYLVVMCTANLKQGHSSGHAGTDTHVEEDLDNVMASGFRV